MDVRIAGTGITATFDTWEVLPRSDTLLYWSHGMEDPLTRENLMAGDKAVSFTVPFDRALENPGFTRKENWGRLSYFVGSTQRSRNRFLTGVVPRLHIYPFLYELSPPIPPALEHLAGTGLCDIMYLTDLQNLPIGTDSITLLEFLNSNVPGEGISFLRRYRNFVILACRTSTQGRVIGLGPPGVSMRSNGLYTVESDGVVMIA